METKTQKKHTLPSLTRSKLSWRALASFLSASALLAPTLAHSAGNVTVHVNGTYNMTGCTISSTDVTATLDELDTEEAKDAANSPSHIVGDKGRLHISLGDCNANDVEITIQDNKSTSLGPDDVFGFDSAPTPTINPDIGYKVELRKPNNDPIGPTYFVKGATEDCGQDCNGNSQSSGFSLVFDYYVQSIPTTKTSLEGELGVSVTIS